MPGLDEPGWTHGCHPRALSGAPLDHRLGPGQRPCDLLYKTKAVAPVRYQQTEFYCGVASLQNAMIALGDYLGQHKIAELAGTAEDGTDEHGLVRAAIASGYDCDAYSALESASARGWLVHSLLAGRSVLLPIQAWEHWVTAIGLLGDNFIVFDPARYAYNVVRSGVNIWTPKQLDRRWKAPKRTRQKHPPYYGIAISKKKDHVEPR